MANRHTAGLLERVTGRADADVQHQLLHHQLLHRVHGLISRHLGRLGIGVGGAAAEASKESGRKRASWSPKRRFNLDQFSLVAINYWIRRV